MENVNKLNKLSKAETYSEAIISFKKEIKRTKIMSLSHKIILEAKVEALEELQLRLLNIDEDYDVETETNHEIN